MEGYTSPSSEKYFEATTYIYKAKYIFQTPTTFDWIVKEGLLTQKDIKKIRTIAKKSMYVLEIIGDGAYLNRAEKILRQNKKDL